MTRHFDLHFTFPRNYEIRLLEAAPPVHPVEKLYHYPVELEEGDRAGTYVRVAPRDGPAWAGFFALGFESSSVVSALASCPDLDSFCIIVGGYAYVAKANDPANWFRVEQRPVVDFRQLPDQDILLFTGFTTMTAVSRSGVAWTTGRLSWEGISITGFSNDRVRGLGWDAPTDKEVAFEVDLRTGEHAGGARPGGTEPASNR
jgi:hypothetical protein